MPLLLDVGAALELTPRAGRGGVRVLLVDGFGFLEEERQRHEEMQAAMAAMARQLVELEPPAPVNRHERRRAAALERKRR